MRKDFYKAEANEYLRKRKPECSHIEYKASAKQLDKILKTICAYGNNYYDNEFSFIYIGVEETDGENEKSTPTLPIKGIDDGALEPAKNSIYALRLYLYPKVEFEVLANSFDGKSYLLIVVERQGGGPFMVSEKAERSKEISLKAGRYVRIESDTRLARVSEEYELLRKFADYHFSSEPSKSANLDSLDFDYMREYLNQTSSRELTSSLTKKEAAESLKLLAKNESATDRVTNFAVLMFSRSPEETIPYSYIEVITDTLGSASRMEAKEFKGPIWKQYYNALAYINDTFIRTITVRDEGVAKNRKVSNFPYKAVEELLANAVVHKNYESGKTVQVYITKDEIDIINYNRPLPPITLEDLNRRTIFKERDSVNPEIRNMFKSLGIIESYGTGVGEAKRACEANGSKTIRYKIFEDNPDITSVAIPCSEEYLALIGEDESVDACSLRGARSPEVSARLKIASSNYSTKVRKSLDKICVAFTSLTFAPKDVIELLKVSPNTATSYIEKLLELNLIAPVSGTGKSKYKFIR